MAKFFTIPPSRTMEAPRPSGHFYLAQPHPPRLDVASSPRQSFYVNGGHWLSKRRDGCSGYWQITRVQNKTVTYKSTGTTDFALACQKLDEHVQAHGEAVPPMEVRQIATVYFIQSETGLIKIGASHDPGQRIKALQAMSPAKLTILATVSGHIGDERAYHKQFAAHRSHGEWFHPHPDILAEITRLARSVS